MPVAQLFRGRGAAGVVAVQTLAVLPPVGVLLWQVGMPVLGLLVGSLLVALGWDFAFSALRRRPFEPFGITTALIFTLFAPPEIGPWHLAVVLSLGCVIGERVFGGRGYAFLSPATVALSLVLLSLPDVALTLPSPFVALACLPGAALLLVSGLFNLRVALAFSVILGLLSGVASWSDATSLFIPAFAGLVFLVCDPTSTAVTPAGRIAHGVLAGALAWVFGEYSGNAVGAEAAPIILAALLASLFAPLLDHAAIAVASLRRARRHG